MNLKAKCQSQFLDQILDGDKTAEFRNLEDFVLTDEDGRVVKAQIEDVVKQTPEEASKTMQANPSVQFLVGQSIYKISIKNPIEEKQ